MDLSTSGSSPGEFDDEMGPAFCLLCKARGAFFFPETHTSGSESLLIRSPSRPGAAQKRMLSRAPALRDLLIHSQEPAIFRQNRPSHLSSLMTRTVGRVEASIRA
jgi:hypothetical protein